MVVFIFFRHADCIANVFDKLAIFDAQAALIDEKSLNRLNRELREVQMLCGKILHGYIFT